MFQEESPSISNKNDNRKSTELLGQKSEISYHVPPSAQVDNEPLSSSSKISDEDDDLLHSSITTESYPNTVIEKVINQNGEPLIQVNFSKGLKHRLLIIQITNRSFKSYVR